MRPLSKLQKIAIGVGTCGGVVCVANYFSPNKRAHLSWTTSYTPSPFAKWDNNWDHRCPKALVKPSSRSLKYEIENNIMNEEIEKCIPSATRHIFLIRHGQYNTNGQTDQQRILTELGRKQADWTGQRLKHLKMPYTQMIKSTMARAQETGDIIAQSLPDVPVTSCSLLEEGAPIPPEPEVGHWRPEKFQFYQDGARIEAAFRQYFHRADCTQDKDSYEILVCHANVIRYFICRALQFPAEAWLRISLNHASVSWISITPNGRVILRQLGDSGHMPPEGITRN